MEGCWERLPPDCLPSAEASSSSQSRRAYSCQLIPHLPKGYNDSQINRLLQVECPARENDFVQVDLVASPPGSGYAASHECYAVVTSSRSGALCVLFCSNRIRRKDIVPFKATPNKFPVSYVASI